MTHRQARRLAEPRRLPLQPGPETVEYLPGSHAAALAFDDDPVAMDAHPFPVAGMALEEPEREKKDPHFQ